MTYFVLMMLAIMLSSCPMLIVVGAKAIETGIILSIVAIYIFFLFEKG